MKTKSAWHFVIVRSAIFILLPLLASLLMYTKMNSVLQSYMESQVAEHASFLGKLASRQLSAHAESLKQAAYYFSGGRMKEQDMGAALNRLLRDPSRISGGILRLDGTPVSGEALRPIEYPAIQNAFRGNSTVRYREGEGFLFTAPIYNGDNIKYTLYEFFDPDALFQSFGEHCYHGQGQVLFADPSQQKMLPISQNADPSYFYRKQDEYTGLLKKLGIDTSAAIYYKDNDSKDFLFVAELEQDNFYLLGTVPYQVVAGSVSSLSIMSLLVFALLLILLFIGTFNTVSANAKAMESDALREAKYIAEQASKSKSTFLANMSHELRTPINVILGMNEMILREDMDPDTKERALDIKSAAQILLSLINDVLDFSKIESGKMNIIATEYNLVNVVRDLDLMTENRARQKSLNFKIAVQPNLPIGLYGDDIHIRQILTNLLTNAVKYTPEGTVTLRVSGTPKGEDYITLHFEVEDTGTGIKSEDIDKLMIPYTRIEEERNRNVEGTGLGMSIIVNLLKLMGSQLRVESVYGKGSNFYFDLEQKIVDTEPVGDIQKRMDDMVKDYDYRVTFAAPNAHILMVDDNSMNRKIFVSLLKKSLVSVTTVSSGKKCLDIVQKEHFDIIFMDHLMPEMDGIETLHRLQELEGNLCKDTPVIALTANAFRGDREKYIGLGFDDFLSKPIVTEKLEELIRELLPKEYVQTITEEIPAADSTAGAAGKEAEPAPELPSIEGVNWAYAKLHISDAELLMQSLRDFYLSIDTEYIDISALAEKADTEDGIADYRIRVHALKSTSALLGILSVSELAKILESAAKKLETEKICAANPILLDELLQTKERLRPFVGQTETQKTPGDTTRLPGFFDMLLFSMEQMDISGADSVMRQIQKYVYEEPIQEQLEQLSEKVAALDFEGAEETINALLESLEQNE